MAETVFAMTKKFFLREALTPGHFPVFTRAKNPNRSHGTRTGLTLDALKPSGAVDVSLWRPEDIPHGPHGYALKPPKKKDIAIAVKVLKRCLAELKEEWDAFRARGCLFVVCGNAQLKTLTRMPEMAAIQVLVKIPSCDGDSRVAAEASQGAESDDAAAVQVPKLYPPFVLMSSVDPDLVYYNHGQHPDFEYMHWSVAKPEPDIAKWYDDLQRMKQHKWNTFSARCMHLQEYLAEKVFHLCCFMRCRPLRLAVDTMETAEVGEASTEAVDITVEASSSSAVSVESTASVEASPTSAVSVVSTVAQQRLPMVKRLSGLGSGFVRRGAPWTRWRKSPAQTQKPLSR